MATSELLASGMKDSGCDPRLGSLLIEEEVMELLEEEVMACSTALGASELGVVRKRGDDSGAGLRDGMRDGVEVVDLLDDDSSLSVSSGPVPPTGRNDESQGATPDIQISGRDGSSLSSSYHPGSPSSVNSSRDDVVEEDDSPPAEVVETGCQQENEEDPPDDNFEDEGNLGSPPPKGRPSERDWLTQETVDMLNEHGPSSTTHHGTEDDCHSGVAAFESVFAEKSQWRNTFQAYQAANYLGDMYGVTFRMEGYRIFCACGKSWKDKKKDMKSAEFGFVAEEDDTKKRKRQKVSDLNCPFFINTVPVVRPTKGDGIKKYDREVSVSSTCFSHNHPMTKRMLIRAKKATNKYAISPDVMRKVMEMLDAGPVPTKTLRNFLQKQYPNTVKVTSVMVNNVRMKAKLLERQYGNDPQFIPNNVLARTFSPNSMEVAPENWDSDPTFYNIYVRRQKYCSSSLVP